MKINCVVARMASCASLLAVCCALPVTCARADDAAAPQDLDKARAYIVQSEKDWVASVVSGRTDPLERIIAADVVDVDTQGHMIDKATMLAQIREAPKYFTSNVLDDVKVRFFGSTTAVAQGSETWQGQNGLPPKGQFVFTDTWILRDGKWQVAATEALMPMEPPK